MEADKAVERLKKVCLGVNFDATGKYVVKASSRSRMIYFYEFKYSVPASSLKDRKPSLFNISVDNEKTNRILPPTINTYITMDYVVNDPSRQLSVQRQKQLFDVLGEDAKNNLLFFEVAEVLLDNNYTLFKPTKV